MMSPGVNACPDTLGYYEQKKKIPQGVSVFLERADFEPVGFCFSA